jgi:hypothetical protein
MEVQVKVNLNFPSGLRITFLFDMRVVAEAFDEHLQRQQSDQDCEGSANPGLLRGTGSVAVSIRR